MPLNETQNKFVFKSENNCEIPITHSQNQYINNLREQKKVRWHRTNNVHGTEKNGAGIETKWMKRKRQPFLLRFDWSTAE